MKSDKPSDMFTVEKPTKPKKEKARPLKPHANRVASVCGLIAGMPASFAKAIESLRDIDRRATETSAMAGILTQSQRIVVATIKSEISPLIVKLEESWRKVDAIIKEGVALPNKEEVDLL